MKVAFFKENLMTAKEVAQELNISTQKVYRLVNDGSIPAYKIGMRIIRFKRHEIEIFKLQKNEIPNRNR